jgi:thiamine transport system ATP-binding protein
VAFADKIFSVNIAIPQGSLCALVGSSGAGKTTILQIISGFVRPQSGIVRLFGKDVTELSPSSRPVNFLFQQNNLFPHLTVEENIGLAISSKLRLKPSDRQVITDALSAVHLIGFEKRLPSTMSAGEKQRVSLARSMLRKQPVLLLDEPFSSCDPCTRRHLLDCIETLRQQQNLTVILATHQPYEIQEKADFIAFIHNHTLCEITPTQQAFSHPQDSFRKYLGY